MIDWDRVTALREEVGPEDFEEVVELFLQEVDEEIEALCEVSSSEGLAAKLHFLKGSALSLGFSSFSEKCQAGESALAQNPDAEVHLADIHSTYMSSREAFLTDLPDRVAGQTGF